MRRAISFLTPFGKSSVPSQRTLDWFPAVGASIGLAVGLVWWAAAKAWAAPAAAAIALAADVAFTGYLHLDGLADSADGLLPPLERQRRLEVMADPAVGAFALVTVVVVLLLRFGALASARPTVLVVGALWCGSRTAMAAVARSMPYARPGGLASVFIDPSIDPPESPGGSGNGADSTPHRSWFTLSNTTGVILTLGLAFSGRSVHGLFAVAGELVGVLAVVLLARKRIGGFTGDVLGAAGVVGETLGLLVLAATR